MRPIESLSEEARIAYQAFLDMSKSKAEHFASMEALEFKYQSGGAPSLSEKLELDTEEERKEIIENLNNVNKEIVKKNLEAY